MSKSDKPGKGQGWSWSPRYQTPGSRSCPGAYLTPHSQERRCLCPRGQTSLHQTPCFSFPSSWAIPLIKQPKGLEGICPEGKQLQRQRGREEKKKSLSELQLALVSY